MIVKRYTPYAICRVTAIDRRFVSYPSLTLENFSRGAGKKKAEVAELRLLSRDVDASPTYANRLKLVRVAEYLPET